LADRQNKETKMTSENQNIKSNQGNKSTLSSTSTRSIRWINLNVRKQNNNNKRFKNLETKRKQDTKDFK